MKYIQALKDGLLIFLQDLNAPEKPLENDTIQVVTPGQYIFQQDNAPIHVSKATKSFFNDYKLEAMDWPANSPDLNPIKNLWVQLKLIFHREWVALGSARISHGSEAMAMYTEMLKRIWKEELGNVALKLVESMPRPIEADIKAKGGHTKY